MILKKMVLVLIIFAYTSCVTTSQTKAYIVYDEKTSLIWQDTNETDKDFSEAVAYCNNLSLGEYDDWRLPSLEELCSIVDITKQPTILDNFKVINNASYWSSSVPAHYPDGAWYVRFKDGRYFRFLKQTNLKVRCVRGQLSKPYTFPKKEYYCK